MQKINPFLWFDNQAEEAVNFYVSLFNNSKVGTIAKYNEAAAAATGKPAGSVMTIGFQLDGNEFAAINGGPVFKFNPSISFFVVLEDEAEVDELWKNLSDGGTELMKLNKFDWSEKYGWIQDKYGLSWQISLGKKKDVRGQTVTPSFLFVGKEFGRAEEAIKFYTSVFKESEIEGILKYEAGAPQPEGTVMHAQFYLNGNTFMAMDSGLEHQFTFNEAISFVVNCNSQEEIDYYWNTLISDGGAESMCGWLKDKFGVSWQIVPSIIPEFLSDENKAQKVMEAVLQMKKLNIAELKKAYDGK